MDIDSMIRIAVQGEERGFRIEPSSSVCAVPPNPRQSRSSNRVLTVSTVSVAAASSSSYCVRYDSLLSCFVVYPAGKWCQLKCRQDGRSQHSQQDVVSTCSKVSNERAIHNWAALIFKAPWLVINVPLDKIIAFRGRGRESFIYKKTRRRGCPESSRDSQSYVIHVWTVAPDLGILRLQAGEENANAAWLKTLHESRDFRIFTSGRESASVFNCSQALLAVRRIRHCSCTHCGWALGCEQRH